MSQNKFHNPICVEPLHCKDKSELTLILFSNSDDTYHHFQVPAQMTVEAFLELALEKLSEGGAAKRVAALKRYYLPVLELQERDGEQELPSHLSLADAGVYNEAVCRIAARPLKERIMFCRYG